MIAARVQGRRDGSRHSERGRLSAVDCPACGSGSTYHRSSTLDYRCRKCGGTFRVTPGASFSGPSAFRLSTSNTSAKRDAVAAVGFGALILLTCGGLRACLCSGNQQTELNESAQKPAVATAKSASPSTATPSKAVHPLPPKSPPQPKPKATASASAVTDDDPYQ